VLVLIAVDGRLTPAALGYAVAAGVLASVVPYTADLIALRFVPARFFSVFMSVHPVLAALVGMVLLGQFLGMHEWLGIAVIVATNAVAVAPFRGDTRTPHSVQQPTPGLPAPVGAAT
jgi:inner membrane transporter RhtA